MCNDADKKYLTRASLRLFLGEVLRTDADLNAFCLDYFPRVYKEFTAGMLRQEKHNLLININPRQQILAHIKEMRPQAYSQYLHLLVFEDEDEEDQKIEGLPKSSPGRLRLYKFAQYIWTFLVMIFIGVVILFNSGKIGFLSDKFSYNLSGWTQLGPPVLTVGDLGPRIWRISIALNNQKIRKLDVIDPFTAKVVASESFSEDCGGSSRLVKTEKYVFLIYSCESKSRIFANRDEKLVWNELDFLRGVGGIKTEVVNFSYQDNDGRILMHSKDGETYFYSSLEDKIIIESHDITSLLIIQNDRDVSILRFGRQKEDPTFPYIIDTDDEKNATGAFQLFEITAAIDPRSIGFISIDNLMHQRGGKHPIRYRVNRISDVNYFSPHILYQNEYLTLILYNTNAARNSPTLLKLLKGTKELFAINGAICEQHKGLLQSYPKAMIYQNKILLLGQNSTNVELLALDITTGRLDSVYRM